MLSDSNEYRIDEATGVLVRGDASSIAYADGGEPYVEKVLTAAKTISDYPVELKCHIKDWASEYHLSPQRVNLLDAVADLLKPEDTVLEIGAGLGILTRWLAERCRHVDAVEGSLARAKINRIRTRGKKNVSVIMDDMTTMSVPAQAYDVVTLTGVLEYAPIGSDRDPWSACRGVLEMARDAITDEGMLVLAIENRLGARYWAGCREDHTGGFFEGIIGYPNPNTAVTWSRDELEALLREAGFDSLQFYHLFPDYKLPTLFMRECPELSTVDAYAWIQDVARDYLGKRQNILPDPLVMESVARAGLLEQFSNSFLVLAAPGAGRTLETEWVIRKYWNKLAPQYHHTISLIDRGGTLRVERKPIYGGKTTHDASPVHFSLNDQDYVSGRLLYFDALQALFSREGPRRLASLLKEVRDGLVASRGTGRKDAGGFEIVDGSSIDYAIWNLIRISDGSLVLIDSKWTIDEEVTEDFVIFRNIVHLLGRLGGFIEPDKHDAFVIQALSAVYGRFDPARLLKHQRLEHTFQAAAVRE